MDVGRYLYMFLRCRMVIKTRNINSCLNEHIYFCINDFILHMWQLCMYMCAYVIVILYVSKMCIIYIICMHLMFICFEYIYIRISVIKCIHIYLYEWIWDTHMTVCFVLTRFCRIEEAYNYMDTVTLHNGGHKYKNICMIFKRDKTDIHTYLYMWIWVYVWMYTSIFVKMNGWAWQECMFMYKYFGETHLWKYVYWIWEGIHVDMHKWTFIEGCM